MDREKIMSGVSLLRRLPPSKIHRNAVAVSNLLNEDLAEELMQKVDKPLELGQDPDNGNSFILCEFNRDGDSYRSPWSNKYVPPLQDANFHSQTARNLEIAANIIFKEYTKLYYQGGVCSCYFWDKDNGGLACAFLVKKDIEEKNQITAGSWDSVNVIDIKSDLQKKKITYSITSTVILEMGIKDKIGGDINISGSLSKAKEITYSSENDKNIEEFHLEKIGKLVEEMEGQLRNSLDTIYVGKTKESIFTVRSPDGSFEMEKQKRGLAKELQNK